MALTTVGVPPELGPAFEKAEEVVSRYFRDQLRDPAHGTIEISGERYVLVRAAALSVEFFGLVADLFGPGREGEAEEFARSILFDLAHAVGKSDAKTFHAKMGLVEPIERMSAGPVHFAHAGWAKVHILPESVLVASEEFFVCYDHPYSFESDAWLRAQRTGGSRRYQPACIMNAGYSSGWCEESFGVSLVAAEVLCRARGDDTCRFVMSTPARIEAHVDRFRKGGAPPSSRRRLVIPDFFSRQRHEDELRAARDELERRVEERTAELTRANALLRREMEERERAESRLLQTYKLEAIGRLAGGIAHDFNNLMAIVTVNCDLLRRRIETDGAHLGERPGAVADLASFVQDIADAGSRAAGLTQQLLAFSRAQPTVRAVLDLNRIVGEMGRMLARVIGEDVVLVTRLADGIGAVEADRGQLEQVLMNLVVNARDAMPGGGTLTIETSEVELTASRIGSMTGRRPAGPGGLASEPSTPGSAPYPADLEKATPGRYVALTVRDTGTGMDQETLAHIFDPFFTTKELGQGTGLGLATVYGIVQQNGGTIAVESAPGAGARFTIYLPRAAGTEAEAPEPSDAQTPRRGTEIILLVEDQERLRDAIGVVLRGYGYEVIEARDGDDAIALAEGFPGPIHLLLTDVVMPRTSGPVLAERVGRIRPGIRVVFMSGYAADAMGQHGSLGGAVLLRKPFEPSELAKVVGAALGG